MSELMQWVNLPANQKLLSKDGELKSKERLGPELHFTCKYKKATLANFKVKVIAIGGKVTYSNQEMGRNGHFRFIEKAGSAKPEGKEIRLYVDRSLPAAGGVKYKISAKYKKKVVESEKVLKTWRRIYYQPIKMSGVTIPALGAVTSEYEKSFIKLKEVGGTGTITYKKNVRSEDWTGGRIALFKEAKKAYTVRDFEPNVVAIVWVEMIASRQEVEIDVTQTPEFKLGARLFSWGPTTLNYEIPGNRCVWWDLEPKDDAANGGRGMWLISGSCSFIDNSGVVHRIPDANVSIDTAKRISGLGGYTTLKIEVPANVKNFFSSNKGKLSIKLRCVRGFSNGYEDPEANVVVVAKSGWFTPRDVAGRAQTLIHELGHKFGMVAEGVGRDPDPPATLYGGFRRAPIPDQKGHQGPHCSEGVTYVTVAPGRKEWQGNPACVMFGSGWASRPNSYCGKCTPIVRKLDCEGSGHPSLSKSVTKF